MWTITHKTNMDFSFPIIVLLLHSLLFFPLVCPVYSSETSKHQLANQTFRSLEEIHKLKKTITNHLRSINKPAIKTFESSHGDIIDCVVSHKQPAFDHSLLKGQKPLDPPERPRGNNQKVILSDNFQLWNLYESCPIGTIPIRRTKEEDILIARSISSFGRKSNRFRRDAAETGHVHSIGYVTGDRYNGAQATINVWAPHVESPNEFSMAQMWIVSGSFENDYNNINTIEAGWQVNQGLYGDNLPRLFIYWTADGYNQTGCYDLLCPGFVQTNNKFPIGTAISPTSTYNGGQYEVTLFIYKDPKNGNWWLEYGLGNPIGYWPSSLFTTLKDNANMVQFGGEIVNAMSTGAHTSTQMGSGHFAEEGYGKASYFKNFKVVGSDGSLVPHSNLNFTVEEPNCYNIKGGIHDIWGSYFYYGGPGRNVKCP